MALKLELIDRLVKRIGGFPDLTSFGSEITILFDHLNSEASNNPVYQKYLSDTAIWAEWVKSKDVSRMYLPTNIDEVVSLAFYLYYLVSQKKEKGHSVAHSYGRIDNNISNSIQNFNAKYLEYFTIALNNIAKASDNLELINDYKKVEGNTVFIIHGHDDLLKTEVQLLLKTAGVNHIVLHQQANKGRTIIEKLIEESDKASFAIALLTPDDIHENGQARARQNVIWEAGYFLGKLGKSRVLLFKKNEVEIPSDLQGILYETYDSAGAWKMKVAKELQAVGIYVDLAAVATTI